MKIWKIELDQLGEPARSPLSPSERERAERIRDPTAARRWAASRAALRELLGRRLGVAPTAVDLAVGAHGKPGLACPTGLEFNLSHSGGLALIALAEVPVGVDVEQVRARRTDLAAIAARALDPDTAAAIAAAEPERRPALFFPAWVRLEARLKCGGAGLGGPPAAGPVAVADLDLGPGYAGAVALAGEAAPAVELYRFKPR